MRLVMDAFSRRRLALALAGLGLALGVLVYSAPASAVTAGSVSAGTSHTCATVDGGAKCWGRNDLGQLGSGTIGPGGCFFGQACSKVSVDVRELSAGVTAVSAGGSHTCAMVDGGAKCWGYNGYGQLGNNSTTNSSVPVSVTGLGSGVSAISAGSSHTCALMAGGSVKCWGANNAGQLGIGTTGPDACVGGVACSKMPVDVTGLGGAVSAITAGGDVTCALMVGGGVKCWGYNNFGQLGNNSTTDSSVPVSVTGLGSGVSAISAGSIHTCALMAGGSVKCWGGNPFGQLGTGTTGPDSCGAAGTACSKVPVDVTGLGGAVSAITAGGSHTCAMVDGDAKCWGYNGYGQLGNNSTTNSSVPVSVTGLGSGMSAISAGGNHTCAVVIGGVKCWGRDDYGQVGDNTTTLSPLLVPVNVDLGGPVITVPATVRLEASSGAGAKVEYVVTAVDDRDGVVPVSCDHPSGEVFPIGTTTVSCTAHDSVGHTSVASFDVVVAPAGAPVISTPAVVDASAVDASGAKVSYEVSAVDVVDGAIVPSCSPGSGSQFKLGTTRVSCTARDSAGNTASASFDVVVRDTTAPVITGERITGEAKSGAGVAVSYTVSAVDNVDGPVSATCTPASGSTFPIGTTIVSCTASDKAGNVGHGSFELVISHTGAPVLAIPQEVVAEASGPNGARVSFSVSAFDLVDGAITPTCTPASGSMFKIGSTTVSCTARDKAGNTSSASFQVVVRHTVGPTIKVPKIKHALASDRRGAIVTYTATAHDNVDGKLTPSCKPRSSIRFKVGTTVVRCTARDKAGHITAANFPVTVHPTYVRSPITTHPDGTITITVRLPGPGQLNILVTAWKDNIARMALLQPAPHRFVYARWHASTPHPHTYQVRITPNPQGRQLLAHPAYQITLRLWITYKLPNGRNRTEGHYGLHLP